MLHVGLKSTGMLEYFVAHGTRTVHSCMDNLFVPYNQPDRFTAEVTDLAFMGRLMFTPGYQKLKKGESDEEHRTCYF